MELAPQPLHYINSLRDFVVKNNLSDDFYPYFSCSSNLERVLSNSKYYISYRSKFEKCYQSKKVMTPPNNIETIINTIVSKIKIFNSSFNKNNIEFKEFKSEESYYSMNKIYYFSSLLFDKPEKLEEFIFGKCLELLQIKIMDLIKNFNFVKKN